jgi:hypothetical protein
VIDRLSKSVIVMGVVGAVWLNVNGLGRPYGQPATHEPSLFHVSALPGGYQAQGWGPHG